ncbi:GyrI-like domain-containing protein [Paenibacillus ehimensis]|uniref:GyrI-like domain-containing protein n=1 Tax=Paenibacillus ehimensis TaxID=79264 RepID=A0ABT8VBX6_9BACL|nr:GyrI-like domain-containing protein [Paenibacillus ehimensis]MDO3678480.1 GyrI-like domain-containing protein [Paenibacillus ehimensis]
MDKLELTKMYKTYYKANTEPELVGFGEAPYLTIAGQGDPNGERFAQAAAVLYAAAYGVKALGKAQGTDFTVPKLEGLWWVESDQPALEVPRQEWRWKLLIRMPDFITGALAAEAKEKTALKKKELAGDITRVAYETMAEGLCVQMLHVGPYESEPETAERMNAYMEARGLVQNGLHHEIYLTDPRKTPPSGWKTILRFPVEQRDLS